MLRHSRPPYELILVDNGSSDGTAAYLEEVQSQPGPERVVVLRNEVNRGFAAGCNQGLAVARGEYLVFLNNDTVVPAGWLDGLVACALGDWPQVGLVSAVTNYSRPPQLIPVDYTDLSGMAAFAARRRRAQAGKFQEVQRLTGFCLLARREVLTKVGGFDEGYGLGFFEDDDLSVRVLQAGYRLRVALDVFIHHFGSRTFRGLGVDCRRQLDENLDLFRTKWGPEQAAGYQRVEPVPSPLPATAADNGGDAAEVAEVVARALVNPPASPNGKPRVSLCMIVKNEEANLPDCLGSVADLVNES